MRRLVLLVLALAVVPPGDAAQLTVTPRDFSPDRQVAADPRVVASGPARRRAAGPCGRPRHRLDRAAQGAAASSTTAGAGQLGHRRIWDGNYQIQLVDGLRVLATSPLRMDQTPARLLNIHARNRDRMPFQGDNERLTTISPNGDKLRESAEDRLHAERGRAGALRGDAHAQLRRRRSTSSGRI